MTAVTDDHVQHFITRPDEFCDQRHARLYRMPPEMLSALQLRGLQARFSQFRDAVPVLKAMADEQGIHRIAALDDVVPILFQHTVYKSYPPSLLEKGRFAQLTRWLDRLTTVDLSDLDLTGVEGIDDWLDAMQTQKGFSVLTSSGTSGTMSFLPRTSAELEQACRMFKLGFAWITDPEGRETHENEYYDMIWPNYRRGSSAIQRMGEFIAPIICGGEERFHALSEGRVSADLLYLAGRLRAAEARGETAKLTISPALKARRAEFESEQRSLQERMTGFVNQQVEALSGKRIYLGGTWGMLYELARSGLEKGLEGVFAPDSVISPLGGAKGLNLPDDWEQQLCRFAGVPRLLFGYGMSEMMATNRLCDHGHYHMDPWIVTFVLDPDTGALLPATGQQTGRMAFYDLTAESYWGGFITGDEVTIDHAACPCGRTTPHILRNIERFSAKRGGDDKITCSATEDARQAAMDFLIAELA